MTWFEIYAMSTPLIVLGLAWGMVALTDWQDRRELQRDAGAKLPAE